MSTFDHVKAKFETSIASILQDLVFPSVISYIREHPNPASIEVGDLMNTLDLAYTPPVVVQSRATKEAPFTGLPFPPYPPSTPQPQQQQQQFGGPSFPPQTPQFQPQQQQQQFGAPSPSGAGTQCLYRFPKGSNKTVAGGQCDKQRGNHPYFCSSHRNSQAAKTQMEAMQNMGFNPAVTNEAPPLTTVSQKVGPSLTKTTGFAPMQGFGGTPMNAQIRQPFQPSQPVFPGQPQQFQPSQPVFPVQPQPFQPPQAAGTSQFLNFPGQPVGPNLNGLIRTAVDMPGVPPGTFYQLVGDVATRSLVFTDLNGIPTFVGRIVDGVNHKNYTTSQGVFLESRNIPIGDGLESVPDEEEELGLDEVEESPIGSVSQSQQVPQQSRPSFSPQQPQQFPQQQPGFGAMQYQPPPAPQSFQPPRVASVSGVEQVGEMSGDVMQGLALDEVTLDFDDEDLDQGL